MAGFIPIYSLLLRKEKKNILFVQTQTSKTSQN